VRAIDWQHPVQSEERCALFREGSERVVGGAVDTAGAATTADLVPRVYAELMKPAPTAPDLAALGDAIEAYVEGFRAAPAARTVLANERARRACRATADPTAPLYTGVACP